MASPFLFDIRTASIKQAVDFDAFFHVSALRKIRIGALWLAMVLFAFFVFTARQTSELTSNTKLLLSLFFILISWSTLAFLLEHFGKSIRKITPSPGESNLAEFLSFESAKGVLHAIRYASKKKFVQIDSSLLLLSLLSENPSLRFIFSRALIDPKELNTFLVQVLSDNIVGLKSAQYSEDFAETIHKAKAAAQQQQRIIIEAEDLIYATAHTNVRFREFLIDHHLMPEQDIPNLTAWYTSLTKQIEESKKFWSKKNLRKRGTFGREWAAGYTITLDLYSSDITKMVTFLGFPKAIGHTNEKEEIQRVLSREQNNNVLLVGEPGCGRKRLIQDFASQSALGETRSAFLNYRRVIELDLPRLLAGVSGLEELESTLQQIFREVSKAKNVILLVDELHNFVGGQVGPRAEPGRTNIMNILAPYLKEAMFPFIGITTFAGLHRYIEQNPSLASFFTKVEVSEISPQETLLLLQEIVPFFEKKYKKFISYPALQTVISYAEKYVQAVPFPKKAIDLLDEAVVHNVQAKDPILLPHHVAAVVTQRTQIPAGELEQKEKDVLLDMEALIHKRIINQEEAVKQVAAALRRARTEIATRKGPMGSFLFMGPTGVGKTETAKALTAIYFGSETRMVRLDMSEFQNASDISRLLGTVEQEGLLTSAVRENPFCLLLLDEIEKAHSTILNLFLQVLDEGHITDGLGRKTDFRHTIIIATSNAGYQLILQAIKQQEDFGKLKERIIDYLFEQGIYRPEFLNRFDGIILFRPLEKHHLLDIAQLMLSKLQKNLEQKGIEFVITEPLKQKIAELGYNPTFGARDMRRVIQDKVENAIAIALLANKAKRGDRITINPQTFLVEKV